MRVSSFSTIGDAEAAAERYRSHGYIVTICCRTCLETGKRLSDYWLECKERSQ